MKLAAAPSARLAFLALVTDKESRHLQDTDARLFVSPFCAAILCVLTTPF